VFGLEALEGNDAFFWAKFCSQKNAKMQTEQIQQQQHHHIQISANLKDCALNAGACASIAKSVIKHLLFIRQQIPV